MFEEDRSRELTGSRRIARTMGTMARASTETKTVITTIHTWILAMNYLPEEATCR